MELPLFLLPSVLFPGMPLKLHIFEERYKIMMKECIDNKSPFGVVLIRSGKEVGAGAIPHLVGTTAHITQTQELPFGRMNIMVIGRDRFRIRELQTDKPYPCADSEILPWFSGIGEQLVTGISERLRPLLKQYMYTLGSAGQVQIANTIMPKEPLALGCLAAAILQASNDDKQKLLEVESTHDFLWELTKRYRSEVQLLEFLTQPPFSIQDNSSPFSTN